MVAVNVVVVLAISVAEAKSAVADDCQLVTEPTLFFKSSFVLLLPEQTVALPSIVPPPEPVLMVTVTGVLALDGQLELLTDQENTT